MTVPISRHRFGGLTPPSNAERFALIVADPEALGGTWVHWLLYGIAGSLRELPEGLSTRDTVENVGTQGTNSFGKVGYRGPCPPSGPSHCYFFRLYALDAPVGLSPRATKAEVLRAIQGHILGKAQLMGRYGRKEPTKALGRAGDSATAVTDESAIPSLTTALNDAMHLIGELTNDDISTRVLAQINLRFARIEEIISEVRFKDRKSTRLNSSHIQKSRMPSSA